MATSYARVFGLPLSIREKNIRKQNHPFLEPIVFVPFIVEMPMKSYFLGLFVAHVFPFIQEEHYCIVQFYIDICLGSLP